MPINGNCFSFFGDTEKKKITIRPPVSIFIACHCLQEKIIFCDDRILYLVCACVASPNRRSGRSVRVLCFAFSTWTTNDAMASITVQLLFAHNARHNGISLSFKSISCAAENVFQLNDTKHDDDEWCSQQKWHENVEAKIAYIMKKRWWEFLKTTHLLSLLYVMKRYMLAVLFFFLSFHFVNHLRTNSR